MEAHNYFKPINKGLKFIVFLILFAVLFATLIYWRENEVQDQISFYHVVIWQVGIWIPWALAFPVFEMIIKRLKRFKFNNIALYGSKLIWIGIHFVWFFYICSIYSPYLGMPATRYGVYPYFFIFWTVVDVGLMWFVSEKLRKTLLEEHLSKPTIFELSRGDKKHFCEPKQIYWLSAEGYYTKLHTDQGNFLIRKSLKYFYEKLTPGDFKRIHRSTVINVNFVSGLVRGTNDCLEVILKDGTRRRVSRNYTKEIRAFFKDWSM